MLLDMTPPDEEEHNGALAEAEERAALVETSAQAKHEPTSNSCPRLPQVGAEAGAFSVDDGMTHAKTAPALNLYQDRLRRVASQFSSVDVINDENQQRGNWGNHIEFLLTCLGYAVGLGNIWRFPYLCYVNGGGAFLLPYLIVLFGCGLPLMLIELTLGQYAGQGPLTVWHCCPILKGIGIGMLVVSGVACVYYNLITAWALRYLIASLTHSLPWADCGDWSSDRCVSWLDADRLRERANVSLLSSLQPNDSLAVDFNQSAGDTFSFAANEYFHRAVLQISEGVHESGGFSWPLFGCLLLAWCLVFAALAKGVKSLGKAVYVTSTFPYLMLAALLVTSLQQPGALDGVRYFLLPDWGRLAEARVWSDAASQIFFSTGVCFGGTITLASYNRFRNNVYRDAWLISIGNSLTSVFSGLVVFSVLGAMAHTQHSTVEEIATSGPGLTFVTYPQAVLMFPVSPLWSALFFVMLVTLALSTMFPITENIVTATIDQWPALRPYKFWATAVACACLCLAGTPLCSGLGMYLVQLLDTYVVGYSLLLLGLAEALGIGWLYGTRTLLDNLQMMVGELRSGWAWQLVWRFLSPALLIFTVVFSFYQRQSLTYDNYQYPAWTNSLGLILCALAVSPVLLYALFALVSVCWQRGTKRRRPDVSSLITPDREWQPAVPGHQGHHPHRTVMSAFSEASAR